jgi:Domain of unknown function DUF29
MGDRTLYDEDILVWSEQQAAALRSLASRRDLPNELDLANVIEEIEDVGRSDLHAAASHVRLILGHLAKGWSDPRSRALRHWAAEVGNWRNELLQRITPSMRGRIDIDLLWRRALRQADLDLAERARPDARERIRQDLNHETCPISLDDLCSEAAEFGDLVARIAASVSRGTTRR